MRRSPTIEIMCRSFHGDRKRLLTNLFPTAAIFLDRARFPFTLVLDDESPEDHALGDMLLAGRHLDRVAYEPLPDNWQELFRGLAFPPPYNRWGYDRQQWSTFYIDRYSDADIIGVVDSDSTFFSYLTEENLIESDGRIRLHVVEPPVRAGVDRISHLKQIEGTAYRNDPVALRAPARFETMWTDRMPMCFWRSTFANLRRHIAERWGTSFDEAFRQFATGPFSQFNILVNYALEYESDRYVAVLQTERGGDLVTVCQNGCFNREDIVVGGIRSFQLGRSDLGAFGQVALRAVHDDRDHLNRFSPMLYNPCERRHVEAHYENVHSAVAALPVGERDARVASLIDFMRRGVHDVYQPPHARSRMPTWLRVAGWDRYLAGASRAER